MKNGLLLSVSAFAMVACQSYTPIALSSAPVGSAVRVTLTDRGRADLAGSVGNGTESIEGLLRALDSNRVEIAVDRVRQLNGDEQKWNRELVTIPRDAVAVASSRKVSIGRSAIVAGAIVGAALAVAAEGLTQNEGGRQGTTKPVGSQ